MLGLSTQQERGVCHTLLLTRAESITPRVWPSKKLPAADTTHSTNEPDQTERFSPQDPASTRLVLALWRICPIAAGSVTAASSQKAQLHISTSLPIGNLSPSIATAPTVSLQATIEATLYHAVTAGA